MTNYRWLTNLQASLWYNLSGYMNSSAQINYNINQPTLQNNVNLLIGFPEDFTKITDTTITIDRDESISIVSPYQIGGSGWNYGFRMNYDVFCKTDRDVEVLLYELSKHTRDCYTYYRWDVVITGSLIDGTTNSLIWFENPICRRLRQKEFTTNIYLNHRGRMDVQATIGSDTFLE